MKKKEFEITATFKISVTEKHLAEMMSKEWQEVMYSFADEIEAAEYLGRLMVLTGKVAGHDGHAHIKPEDVTDNIFDEGEFQAEAIAP